MAITKPVDKWQERDLARQLGNFATILGKTVFFLGEENVTDDELKATISLMEKAHAKRKKLYEEGQRTFTEAYKHYYKGGFERRSYTKKTLI